MLIIYYIGCSTSFSVYRIDIHQNYDILALNHDTSMHSFLRVIQMHLRQENSDILVARNFLTDKNKDQSS